MCSMRTLGNGTEPISDFNSSYVTWLRRFKRRSNHRKRQKEQFKANHRNNRKQKSKEALTSEANQGKI